YTHRPRLAGGRRFGIGGRAHASASDVWPNQIVMAKLCALSFRAERGISQKARLITHFDLCDARFDCEIPHPAMAGFGMTNHRESPFGNMTFFGAALRAARSFGINRLLIGPASRGDTR